MTRYMEENMELYSKYRIATMHAHESIDGVETNEPVIFQQELIIDLMDQNSESSICDTPTFTGKLKAYRFSGISSLRL